MEKPELFEKLHDHIMSFDTSSAVKTAQLIVESDLDVMEAIDIATSAVTQIGDQFECGDIFLPQLMMAGETMKQCMSIFTRHIGAEDEFRKKGKVVIGAVSGDIHDIGKNLVATMLSVHGFDVVDLGVDVPPMEIADRAESEGAQVIALSSLMTTSMPYQRDVLELLQELGVRDKFYVIVGGGPVTEDFAQEIGADGWGLNAVSAVRICEQLLEMGEQPPLSKTLLVQ
jgi:corrinoid protein of di/trimethylamine methyltransferase